MILKIIKKYKVDSGVVIIPIPDFAEIIELPENVLESEINENRVLEVKSGGVVIACWQLSKGDSVILMNDDGKTIDRLL